MLHWSADKTLAERCDELLGLDVSETALAVARARCHDKEKISFARMRVPNEMPEGRFDLVVMSEVAYYWSISDLEKTANSMVARHERGGHLILVHLTEDVPDYPLTGDEVHEYWLSRAEWNRVKFCREERFRIDVLEKL